MNAEFFALTFTATLNPEAARPRPADREPAAAGDVPVPLLGGMTVALTIGLLDVLIVHAGVISSQGKAIAGADLALGLLLLLVVGGLPATGRMHGSGRRSRQGPGRRRSRGWRRRSACPG